MGNWGLIAVKRDWVPEWFWAYITRRSEHRVTRLHRLLVRSVEPPTLRLVRPTETPDYSKHPDDEDPNLENWSSKPRRHD